MAKQQKTDKPDDSSQVYMSLERDPVATAQDRPWWLGWKLGYEPHEALNGMVERMKLQQSVRYTNWRKLISMHEWGFKASQYETLEDAPIQEYATCLNAAQNILETVHAKVCKSRIVPMPLTAGGGYLQRKRAKDLQKCLEGEFDDNCIDKVKEDVVLDALVLGAGVAKVYCEWGRIKVAHIPTEDIVIDDGEGRLRCPRSMYHMGRIDKFVALECYGGEDSDLHGTAKERRDAILKAPMVQDKGNLTTVQPYQIQIIEAWHLPSRPISEAEKDEAEPKHDGRHTITIDGCTLVDEPWRRDDFPFAFYIPRPRRRSFWGLSMLHQIAGAQREFEAITRKIQKAHEWMGGSHWLAHVGAEVNPRELDNDAGTIVQWAGNVPPQEWTPQPVAPQTYQHAQTLTGWMREHTGVSQLSTSGQIPAGLQQASGKALQVYDDVEAERLRAYHSELDRWHVQVAQLIICEAEELAERGESYEVPYRGKKAVEKLDWEKVLLDEADYVLKVFPVSILARSPAAKFEQLQELLQAGAITIEQFRRLFELPDLESENEIDTADTDIIDRNLDIIVVEGRYLSPEPFDNLALAKSRAAKFYNVCRANEVPEDRLEMLRNYIADCDALLQPPESSPMPAMPGAVPGMAAPAPLGPPGMPPPPLAGPPGPPPMPMPPPGAMPMA